MPLTPELLKNPREVMNAAPDVMRMALGLTVLNPHPLASSLTTGDIALVLGRGVRPQQAHETDSMVMARGLGTGDFSKLIADSTRGVVERRYTDAADHLAFAVPVPARDFRPFGLPAVDADALALAPTTEAGEFQRGGITTPAGTATATLATYGRAVTISRRAIIDGSLAALDVIASGAGVNAARLESRLVADALEANGKLDDDAVVFHDDFGNVVASALDATSIGTGMQKLRTQRTAGGELADVAARHLVVEPALELLARKLVHEAGMGEQIAVHVLASLPTGRWYLLGDPALQPAVGVLRLGGARVPALIEQTKTPMNVDGVSLRVRADAGATMLGRVGIVRGGA